MNTPAPLLILGTWKSVEKDLTLTFEENNVLRTQFDVHDFQKKVYTIVWEGGLINRWKLTAPQIGLHLSFIKSIDGNNLIIDNVKPSPESLKILPDGEFMSGSFDRFHFTRKI